MDKLKVLFISAANSIHTVKWVNALSNEFEVHLAYCKNHKPNLDAIDSKVVLHELRFKAPFGYYLNALQLRKVFNHIKPNIINVHYASGYGTLARMSRIKPILLSVWGSDVYEFPNESKTKRKILEKNVMYANYIASTSNVMAEELKRQVPQLEKEIYITPFGVNVDNFKKKQIEKEENIFSIGNIKSLKEIYGIEYGILAVKLLKERLIEKGKEELANSIRFYIYGDGTEKENLENLIKKENLQDTVFLKGKIPNTQVPEALSQLDVFCVTSNKESFGVAVIEAMACEVPVVATRAEGFCEVMQDGITGYLVGKKDVNQIAEALEKLLEDEEKRLEMGKNGRKRVLAEYNWNKNVDKMISIYKMIINNQKEG